MSFKKNYDVFIAYHGTYAENGSRVYADKIYKYLTSQGLNCFYFPYESQDAYKANIIDVMSSRVFLLVCTNGLNVLENGKIDQKHHYELSTEIDAFYALTQIGEANVTDAKIVVCGDYYKGDEAKLHELFSNRTHFFHDGSEKSLQDIYQWALNRISSYKSWQDTQITSEIKEVFATRAAMNPGCQFDDLIANAHFVRVVGISNSEMTARINPNAIINCVENGGTIEILFLDPEGQYTKLREEEEGLRSGRIKNITYVNIETAIQFYDRLQMHKDNFNLYIYDKQPRMNMIFIDNYLILQYYANNIPGIENPSFLIEKQDNSPIFKFCEKVYNYLRAEAKRIEVEQ